MNNHFQKINYDNYNGRVNAIKPPPDIMHKFALQEKIPAKQCTTYRNPIPNRDNTLLSTIFFSANNIQILQNGIRAGVYYKSNKQYIIAEQDCDQLKIIMNSIFTNHSLNLTHDITKQIESLNQLVLDYCIPNVFGETQGYMNYLRDVSTLKDPIPLPIMTTIQDKNSYKMPNPF